VLPQSVANDEQVFLERKASNYNQGSHSILDFNLYLKYAGILKVYWNVLDLKKCTGICTGILVWQ